MEQLCREFWDACQIPTCAYRSGPQRAFGGVLNSGNNFNSRTESNKGMGMPCYDLFRLPVFSVFSVLVLWAEGFVPEPWYHKVCGNRFHEGGQMGSSLWIFC